MNDKQRNKETDEETIRCLEMYEAGDEVSALRHLRDVALRRSAVNEDVMDYALETSDVQLCRFALEIGANVNDDQAGFTPLARAIDRDDIQLVATLIENGAAVDQRVVGDRTPLMYAIDRDQALTTPIVHALLKAGANPNAICHDLGESTPLMIASKRGRLDDISVLLDAGADPGYRNGEGQSYIAVAAKKALPSIQRIVESRGKRKAGH